jgi:hypothetical protein
VIRAGIVIALLALLTLGAVSTVAAHGDDNEPEVKVSMLANGRCGHLEGSLPALITRNGIRPGDVAGDVTVCVANTGDGDATLSLGVTELVELDPRCTDSEATRDASCGGGRRGELGPSLLQQVGIGGCPSTPEASPALERRLTALQAGSLGLRDRLGEQELVCVRLRLRYEPTDTAAAVASQSDRTFWRYALTVTANTKEE